MKKTIGMIAIMLLFNACGLFKKTSKKKQSELTEVLTTVVVDLKKEKQTQVKKEADLQSFVWLDGEILMQLEGENITVAKDGTVRMGKGKVNQQSREKSNAVQLMSETTEVEQHEKKRVSQAAKQEHDYKKKISTHVNKPRSSVFLWFGIAVLLLLCFFCVKKWIA